MLITSNLVEKNLIGCALVASVVIRLIELSTSLSNRILRKGDVFSIYVDVHNISDKPIDITNVKLVSPLGFIQLSEHGKQKSLAGRIGAEITVSGLDIGQVEFDWKKIQQQLQGTPQTDSQSVTVQSMEKYRVNFNMQAGRRIGLLPRPDTYTISVEVVYISDGTTTHHKQLSTDISIFPPIVGMLGGTLLGSFLGTMIKNLQAPSLGSLLAILITNLTLGFIVGVILMRKKDVQPFVTVEDFWGGILLGFLLGFGGQALFEQITGISLGGNATSTS